MEALKRHAGQGVFEGMTPEQIEEVRREWGRDPDPTHKPHKTIKAALSKAGIE